MDPRQEVIRKVRLGGSVCSLCVRAGNILPELCLAVWFSCNGQSCSPAQNGNRNPPKPESVDEIPNLGLRDKSVMAETQRGDPSAIIEICKGAATRPQRSRWRGGVRLCDPHHDIALEEQVIFAVTKILCCL